jgi:hypothetical protein
VGGLAELVRQGTVGLLEGQVQQRDESVLTTEADCSAKGDVPPGAQSVTEVTDQAAGPPRPAGPDGGTDQADP